jgi:L-rhamnose mutarotase
MSQKINILISPQQFLCRLREGTLVELGENEFWISPGTTQPHCDYSAPANFPECCNFHKSIKEQTVQWLQNFPNCCENHKALLKTKWFRKSIYVGLPDKIVTMIRYTENFVAHYIGTDDWHKEITDYIEYNFQSFGTPDIGLELYKNHLRHWIKNNNQNYQIFTDSKRKSLLEYLEVRPSKERDTDINLLYDIFQRWVKLIPDLQQFGSIKKSQLNKLPLNIMLHQPEHNKYTGLAKAKIKTRSELLNFLIDLTKGILLNINSTEIIATGNLEEIKRYNIKVLNESHILAQKTLLEKFSKGETEYMKLLKNWLLNEKKYFKTVTPLLPTPNLTDKANLIISNDIDNNTYNELIIRINQFGQRLESFATLYRLYGENHFRDNLLLHLIGITTRYNATGETFNKNGKTDVLVKDDRGEIIFIAECKLWSGSNIVGEALDQLLSRYLRHRDDRAALIIFNKENKDFSDVCEKALAAAKLHKDFSVHQSSRNETSHALVFRNNQSPQKLIYVELILFNYA